MQRHTIDNRLMGAPHAGHPSRFTTPNNGRNTMRNNTAFRWLAMAAVLVIGLVIALALIKGMSELDEALFSGAAMAAVATPRKRRPRLIAYIRVSALGKRDEADLNSPHDQLAAIREYCDRHGFEIVEVVTDLNESGAKAQRKNLRAIVARIKSGDVDGIAVLKLNRLSRLNPLERAELFNEIEEQGRGLVVSATQGHEWKTRQQRLIREIFVAMDRYEWEEKNEEFELAKRNAVAAGVHISGKTPTGYDRATVKPRKLVPNADADHIRAVWQLRGHTDATLGDCVRYLQQHLPHHKWTRQRVAQLLRNRVYLGEARQSGAELQFVNPNAHDALVDADTFRLVQAKFTTREAPARAVGTDNLLAGMCRCGSCLHSMERTKVQGGRYVVYRCKQSSTLGPCPAPASIMAHHVDALVKQVVEDRMANALKSGARIEIAERDAIRQTLLATYSAKQVQRDEWATPDTRELVGDAAWTNGLVQLDDELAALDAQLAEVAPTHDARPSLDDALAILRDGTTAEQREVIAGEVDSVMVSRAPRGTAAADRISVHFVGDPATPARPGRGRKNHAEVVAGELAA